MARITLLAFLLVQIISCTLSDEVTAAMSVFSNSSVEAEAKPEDAVEVPKPSADLNTSTPPPLLHNASGEVTTMRASAVSSSEGEMPTTTLGVPSNNAEKKKDDKNSAEKFLTSTVLVASLVALTAIVP